MPFRQKEPVVRLRTWSTWSAVINLTPRTGELRSAPSWPDARHRVAGKRALALGGARSQGHNTGLRGLVLRFGFPLAAERPLYSELKNTLRGLVPCTRFPLNCRTPPLLGANGHTTLYSTYVHGYASCAPARLRSQSPFLRPSGRALGSSRSLARLPGVTRLPLQSFLMPLPRLWPRLRFAFDWYRSLRERRRPGRGLPGRGRRP